jgi:phage baseplate assembly protein W
VSLPDGPHLSFPFRVGRDGRTVCVASRAEHVRDEVVQLILTSQGERPFLPEFGGGARRLVFEGTSDATQAMAKAMVSQALQRWLGSRVTVEELTVQMIDTQITIDLLYRLAGEPDSRQLRFQRNG